MGTVDERLDWARVHLDRLRPLVDEHARRARRAISDGENIQGTGVTETWAVIDVEAAPTVGLTAADAIHNLRATLDNLVWEVASDAARQRMATRLAFPAGHGPARFAKFDKEVLQVFSRGQGDAIRLCQPFVPVAQGGLPNNGGDLLGLLDDLWNRDKHRVPTVVVASVGGTVPGGQIHGSVDTLRRVSDLEVWFVPAGSSGHATINHLDRMHDLVTSEVVPRLRRAPR